MAKHHSYIGRESSCEGLVSLTCGMTITGEKKCPARLPGIRQEFRQRIAKDRTCCPSELAKAPHIRLGAAYPHDVVRKWKWCDQNGAIVTERPLEKYGAECAPG